MRGVSKQYPTWDLRIFSSRAAGLAVLLAAIPGAAVAQSTVDKDVVVRGQRGSAVSDIQPVAKLDARAIAATGASSMDELLKAIEPLTRSANGGMPVYLLNGQRIGGFDELRTLPPEAITSFEIMPAQAALKFGYPASQAVVNIITKSQFAQAESRVEAGTTTDGGSSTGEIFAGLTRISGARRLSLDGTYHHTDPLLQSRRRIAPDPDNPFDAIGTISAIDGGEIDPALSAAAGHPVFIAAVPADPAQRNMLGAYADGADKPRSFDIGPYRTLIGRNDQVTLRGVLGGPLSKTITGTLTLTAERSLDRSLQGLSAAAVPVPADNPFSPFGKDVLLDRYLTEGDPLVLRTINTKLNLSGALHGRVAGWNWDLTGGLSSTDIVNRGPHPVNPGAIDQAVAAGANPFAPFDAALLADRLDQHSRSISRDGSLKTVVMGAPFGLPAGAATLTLTAEAERATAHIEAQGFDSEDFTIGRTRIEGGGALDLPILSPDVPAMRFVGRLSANLSANVRQVEGYGALTDTSYGLVWSPTDHLQWIGTVKHSATAPAMDKSSAPTVRVDNVPFFDAVAGQSALVTTITGGNPDLRAAHRSTRTLDLTWQAPSRNFLSFAASYYSWSDRHPIYQITALTPATESAFPDLFERDATGRLTTVRFQPLNFYRESGTSMAFRLNYRGPIGKAPPKPADGKPAPDRPMIYFSGYLAPILEDHLQLQPGGPILDLVHGDAFDASANVRRFTGSSWSGLWYKALSFDLQTEWVSGTDIHGGSPEADLHFAPLLKFTTMAQADLNALLPHSAWAHKSEVRLTVENLFNRRQQVHDATGATPNRYQPDYLDPLGRTIKVSVRKRF